MNAIIKGGDKTKPLGLLEEHLIETWRVDGDDLDKSDLK
jgi:hypothetical protein